MNNKLITAKIMMVLLAVGVVVSFSEEQVLLPTFYGGQGGDYCTAIINTPDNGYLLAGSNTSFTDGASKAYIIKVDSIGDTIWSKTYMDGGRGIKAFIKVTSNKYGAIGSLFANSVESENIWFLLIDSLGEVLFSGDYGGVADEFGTDLYATADGGFILCGDTYVADTTDGPQDGLIVKLDSSGTMLWQTNVGDTIHAEATLKIAQRKNKGYEAIGIRNVQAWLDSGEIYLVKLNEDGNILWEKTYKGLGYARGYEIMEQSNGNLILAGETNVVGERPPSIYAIGVDSTGNVLWEYVYKNQDDHGSYLSGSTFFNDNRMLLIGMVDGPGEGNRFEGRAILIDSVGEIIWMNDYPDLESVTDGTTDPQGKIILAGNSTQFDQSGNNFCIFQVDSLGNADFSKIHDYVGVRNEYTPPYTINRLNNLQEKDNSVSLDCFTLTGRKISPRLEIHTGARSVVKYRRSGISIARIRGGKTTRSGKVVRVK